MAKSKAKTGVKTTDKNIKQKPAMQKMTTVCFRTRFLLKKKAEGIFEDMGISTSAAINMFLAQVVREKGMPFTPHAKQESASGNVAEAKPAGTGDNAGFIALDELWDEL